jgi:ABC-type sugar transport system ATPase subunit
VRDTWVDNRRDAILTVHGLRVPGRLEQIDFTLHRGEILGITGLLGSGHALIPRCLFGIEKAEMALSKNGCPIRIRSPRDALKAGLGLLTENRKEEGLYLRSSVLKNTTLLILQSVAIRAAGWIRSRKESMRAEEYIKLMNIMTPSLHQLIRYLSGGNQQKVIMARWLLRDPDVLMFIEPTRGIDIGSKSEIYHYLHRIAREREKGIIVVSTELAEVVGISDRILAMYNGRIVEEIIGEEATEEMLMKRITGG